MSHKIFLYSSFVYYLCKILYIVGLCTEDLLELLLVPKGKLGSCYGSYDRLSSIVSEMWTCHHFALLRHKLGQHCTKHLALITIPASRHLQFFFLRSTLETVVDNQRPLLYSLKCFLVWSESRVSLKKSFCRPACMLVHTIILITSIKLASNRIGIYTGNIAHSHVFLKSLE